MSFLAALPRFDLLAMYASSARQSVAIARQSFAIGWRFVFYFSSDPRPTFSRARGQGLCGYNQPMAGGRRYDVVLIGGGVIGSSVAMALARARAQDRRGRYRSQRTAQLQRKECRRRARDLVAAGQYHALPRVDQILRKRARRGRLPPEGLSLALRRRDLAQGRAASRIAARTRPSDRGARRRRGASPRSRNRSRSTELPAQPSRPRTGSSIPTC